MATNGLAESTKHLPIPWIETPLIYSASLSQIAGCNIYLKLENLQPSGSFKSRGVGNFLLSHLKSATTSNPTHFYSSSGGNAGLACVDAASSLGAAASVIVPVSTSPYMISKIRDAGAKDVIQHGASWVEADAYMRETVLPKARNEGEDAVYVPPFDAQTIWDGNATMVEEIKNQLGNSAPRSKGRPDLVICSVGGGGLFNGIMQGLMQSGMQDVPVLAVETKGADSLAQSVQEGTLVTLPAITSLCTSLGARTVARKTLENGLRSNVRSLVLEDKDAVEGSSLIADKHRMLVEPACGVNVAACTDMRLRKLFKHLNDDSNVVVILCGGSNLTVDSLQAYRKEYT